MSKSEQSRPTHPVRDLILFFTPGTIILITLLVLWFRHPDVEYWKQQGVLMRDFFSDNLWICFLIMAIAPGIFFPLSGVYLFFGGIFTEQLGFGVSLAVALFAQYLCLAWSYTVARGPLKDYLSRYTDRFLKNEDKVDGIGLRFGFFIRITPGIPYAAQNVILGVIGLSLKKYLIVSVPTLTLWTAAFVITGGAIFEGKTGLTITGILAVIALVLITRILSSRKKKDAV